MTNINEISPYVAESARRYSTPLMSSLNIHHVERMEAIASGAVAGALQLKCKTDDYESFDLCFFTDDAAMAKDLAEAINAALAKHNRLIDQIVPAPVSEAAE